jgi:hypothetical protein
LQQEAEPIFHPAEDVCNAGVLLMIPALLSQGLLKATGIYSPLRKGYYGLVSVLLIEVPAESEGGYSVNQTIDNENDTINSAKHSCLTLETRSDNKSESYLSPAGVSSGGGANIAAGTTARLRKYRRSYRRH